MSAAVDWQDEFGPRLPNQGSWIKTALAIATDDHLKDACRDRDIDLVEDLDDDDLVNLCEERDVTLGSALEIDEGALHNAASALQYGHAGDALVYLEKALLEVDRPAFGRLQRIIESHYSARPPHCQGS